MIKINKLNPFGRMCVSMGMLPSSYKESLTYEEQLLWFMRYLEEVVIPACNNNADAIIELQGLYEQLKEYVDNYFENLDVQEEINNKLDDMAESGELEEIIGQYLSLAGILVYDTVSDMKSAENLIDGSICRTLGYYSLNDGGSSLYKVREITNSDVIDEASIIALDDESLVATIVCSEVNLPAFGLYGDGTHDDTTKFQNAVSYAKTNNLKVTSPKNKVYLITDTIDVSNLLFDLNDATIKANSAIDMLEIDEQDSYKNGHFQNFTLDCNNIATKGINIVTSRRSKFNNINMVNVAGIGIHLQAGYENMFDLINMQSVELTNTSNIGFKIETGDSNFTNITCANICNPFYLKRCYGNYFDKIHTWIGQSALLDYSIMFVIDIPYPENLMMNEIYCDTMQKFIKFASGSAGINNGSISELILDYNKSIYTRTNGDAFVFDNANNSQIANINITDSHINGLYYEDSQPSDAQTIISTTNEFEGNIENSFYSAIGYSDIKALTNVDANVTLGINNVFKSDKTIYINIVGSYDSSTTSGNINLGKIPNDLCPKGAITTTCIVSDARWAMTNPSIRYMYIPVIDSGEAIQINLPSGAGTKYFFITLCYNRN